MSEVKRFKHHYDLGFMFSTGEVLELWTNDTQFVMASAYDAQGAMLESALATLDRLSGIIYAARKRAALEFQETGLGSWSEQYDLLVEAESLTDSALSKNGGPNDL